MSCHPDRVRQNYCEHDFKDTYGITITDMIVAAKICIKCNKIEKLGYPGIDPISPSWYENTADLSHIRDDIENLFIPRNLLDK